MTDDRSSRDDDGDRSPDGTAEASATSSPGSPGQGEDAGASRADRARDLGRLTRAVAPPPAGPAGCRCSAAAGWSTCCSTSPRASRSGTADTLRAQHPGLSDDDLAQTLISGAAKASSAIGAAGGALAAVEFAAPPTLLTAPAQIAAETLVVAAAEIKLIAELHEVYGVPATGPSRPCHRLRRRVVRAARLRPVLAVRDAECPSGRRPSGPCASG